MKYLPVGLDLHMSILYACLNSIMLFVCTMQIDRLKKRNIPTLSMYSETFLKRTLNKPSNVGRKSVIVV